MTTISNTFDHGVAWEGIYGYSQALQVGDTVYISGQLSHDDQGLVGENDIDKQLEMTFANLDRVLEHFGATRRQVIETRVIMTDFRENFGPVGTAHSAYFGGHRPTSTTFGVTELALPGQLVEVGAIVLLDLPR
jgi:2-iminobutanoate/2-iminopropanoate deaminase